jgi:hypothetical protein
VPSIAKALAKGRRILRVIVFGERSDARPKIQLSPSVGVGRGASTSGTKCDRTKCDLAIPVDVVVVVVEMDVLAEMGVKGGSRWLETLRAATHNVLPGKGGGVAASWAASWWPRRRAHPARAGKEMTQSYFQVKG